MDSTMILEACKFVLLENDNELNATPINSPEPDLL